MEDRILSFYENKTGILDLSDLQLTELPPIPDEVKMLICKNNLLTSLPDLPDQLTTLIVSNNKLNALPSLPVSLTTLDVSKNKLQSLPFLQNLTELNCADNFISFLPHLLPENLKILRCSTNQIAFLPPLPDVTELYCNENALSFLPPLPATLTKLYCQHNELHSLPILPRRLKELNCRDNHITEVSRLPDLFLLKCDAHKIKNLDELPESLCKEDRDYIHEHRKPEQKQEFMKYLKRERLNTDRQIAHYYEELPHKERKQAIDTIKDIAEYQSSDKPILFKIMELPLSIAQRNHIFNQYTALTTSQDPSEKLRTWFDALMTIPFGTYSYQPVETKPKKVKDFLSSLQESMDRAVYGHDEAKRQIIQMMGQQIRNPSSKGNMMGIYGPPGCGKTTLIKEGISKAMNRPFVFISLGGATDASILEGHSFTYVGSIYGRIANALITSKCMDPIIYFDELDKISKTPKGEEITNVLIHLTDPAQNDKFHDKYFHGVDIDLSRVTMFFSFNDPSTIDPILLDRITTVETKYLMPNQKLHIATNYLIPEMTKELGLEKYDITVSEDALQYIITHYTHEGGVRKLKSLLYNIARELNIANLLKQKILDRFVTFPFIVEQKHVKELLKEKREIEPDKIHAEDKIGVINGMYASSNGGMGGILPIEVLWIPTSAMLEVKATGNLKQVINESTMVATTLAFNHIDPTLQKKYLKQWKKRPMGFHVHLGDGSTPKDGPSAGTALTIGILSLLTEQKIRRDIAITGEINLQGQVTAIGGLEAKLEGAKQAGVTLALYPKENEKDVILIKKRNPSLFTNLNVIPIETLNEAMKHSFVRQ
jgi:endopeptidase La